MVVTAAAGGTIATVEEAAMAAAVEAGDGLACDDSATEEWMIGRRASIGFWSEIRIHYFCPHELRAQFDNPAAALFCVLCSSAGL